MDKEILTLCRAMGAGPDQEELLLPLVRAVREQLAGRLRGDAEPEDCGPAFPLAAAMVVMDHLEGITGEKRLSSFTAGELTIRREAGTTGQRGKSLSRQAEELLAPWTEGSGFAFQGVSG